MLILTRRIGETIMIGDDVKVTVLDVKGNQIRLGTNAPKEVEVHREEIYRKIQLEKQGGSEPELEPELVVDDHNRGNSTSYSASTSPQIIVKKKKINND